MGRNRKEDQRFLGQMRELAEEQLDSGRSPTFIIDDLVAQGLDMNTATRLVDELNGGGASNFGGRRNTDVMVIGALWFSGGLLVTLVTFLLAVNRGTFVVAWGAMIWGIIRFVQGYKGIDKEV